MGAIVFAFGLVHGLGLSTRLQDLGLPDSGLVERVLLFNVGVELGQLTALVIIVGVGTLLVRRLHPSEEIRKTAFIALVTVGLVAAAVISFPADDSSDSERVTAGGQGTSCTETTAQPTPLPGGGHPEKIFFAPGELVPEEDLAHVLGDGYVIVRYRADLPPKRTRALQNWAEQTDPPYVIAAPANRQRLAILAATYERELRCTKPDMAGLTRFRNTWFEQVGAL